jgi:large subunit ribosomal protein L25
MPEITLSAEPRAVIGKQVSALRRKGIVPVVLYGGHQEPKNLQIEERALRKTLKQAGGFRLIAMQISGAAQLCLARDVQQHPITRKILHADFQAVVMSEKIILSVPLRFNGESPAVRAGLGLLIHSRESVQIEALPGDLIDYIEADISQLQSPGQAVHVSDLKVGDKVRIVTHGEETLALIVATKEEKLTEETTTEEEATAEVEVIKKEKADEAEAEEGEKK